MKCKLQQPVKDFMLILLAVIIVIGTLTLLAMGLFWIIGYTTIQFDICIVGEKVFQSPSEVYYVQGIVISVALIVAGLLIFTSGSIFASGSILFLVGTFIKFLVKAIFIKGEERNWFKENIYNCEGN